LMMNFPAFLAIFFAWSRIFIERYYYTIGEIVFSLSVIPIARLACSPRGITSQAPKLFHQ
jgi:hypothetical protein